MSQTYTTGKLTTFEETKKEIINFKALTNRWWRCRHTVHWAWTCPQQSAEPSSPEKASYRSQSPVTSDGFSTKNININVTYN